MRPGEFAAIGYTFHFVGLDGYSSLAVIEDFQLVRYDVFAVVNNERDDVHNKDEKLRTRKLMGVNILSGLSKKKDKWEGGRIYNPKNGKDYKCSIWLEGNTLKVRGYIGFLYETQTWTRK